MSDDEPKPPADTTWITMEPVRDGPTLSAIYGVAFINALLLLLIAVLVA